MRELFIYYRVDPRHTAGVQSVLEAMQSRLRQRHPGLTARWLRREDDASSSPAPQTWMEIYAVDPKHAPDGITRAQQADIETEARALAGLIDGERHTEAFRTCAS